MGFNFADAYSQNADALAGDVLPEGDYTVGVKSAKAVQTTGGKPAIRLQLEVLEGPFAGRTIPDQLTWSPESEVAMRIFSQSLNVLGASREWITTTGADGDAIADRIAGSKALVGVKISEWNGQDRNNVNYKKAVEGGMVVGGSGGGGIDDAEAVPLAATPSWP